VSRRNFTELCRELTDLDERAYAESWRRLGLSVDWDLSYRTIDQRVRAVSQLAFLRNVARGEAYQAEAPTLWDVTFGTAVAQAEIEDRELGGTFVRLPFALADSEPDTHRPDDPAAPPAAAWPELIVATTRPELLPGCVALVAHPDDKRYQHLLGSAAITPLFGVRVPILAHRLADPDKGSGLVMVCTFGDTTDVTWWRDLRLETRPVLGPDGRVLAAPPAGLTTDAGIKAYAQLAGLTAKAARHRVTELLEAAGLLRGEPEAIRHPVKFYERGEVPLEIITTRQWYIRNGSRDPDLAGRLLARGRELTWHPEHMRARYEHWVTGLTGDWLLSRQRYYGVPIPVWYPLDASGQIQAGQPIVPDEASLPVDPVADAPPGYQPEQRGQPGGFAADPDVMDTWATSSLTPLLASGWPHDRELMNRVFPMDLRPQAHEIIRTWLFYAVLRTQLEEDALPWRHAAISGWILDPDRKKMSKSAGNVATPADLLREHGSDAVRYWAASARLGVDTAIDVAQVKIGRRLAIKVLNAARFVLSFSEGEPGEITAPIDLALIRRLAAATEGCTTALDSYEHASALAQAERFFWFFCDDYLELVKARAYGEYGAEAAASARATLRLGLSVVLRLLAPMLPFVTEDVWSWWQDGSVHLAAWPDAAALRAQAGPGDDSVLGRGHRRDQEGKVGGQAADEESSAGARRGRRRRRPDGHRRRRPGRAVGRPCRRDRTTRGHRGGADLRGRDVTPPLPSCCHG
jgi:valyl-tRNA synthetase